MVSFSKLKLLYKVPSKADVGDTWTKGSNTQVSRGKGAVTLLPAGPQGGYNTQRCERYTLLRYTPREVYDA